MEAWERIETIIKNEGLNKNSFSNKIGLSNNVTITRILNEKRNPSNATLEKVIQAFPQYNPNWILNGEGDMKSDSKEENSKRLGFRNRLKYLLDNKKVNGKRVTVCQIGKNTSISMAAVDKYLKGSIPAYDKAKILADYFGVTVDWLMTGEESFKEESNATLIPVPEFIEVPLVQQKAYAGYLSGYADPEFLEILPTSLFIVDHTPHGKYIAFEIKGDSMDDGTIESYREGDRVLCREVQMHLWADSKLHFDKWDFVIVHSDGILIKRIIDHDVENKTITVHSLNPQYPDRILSLCDVRQILNVVQQMRPRMR